MPRIIWGLAGLVILLVLILLGWWFLLGILCGLAILAGLIWWFTERHRERTAIRPQRDPRTIGRDEEAGGDRYQPAEPYETHQPPPDEGEYWMDSTRRESVEAGLARVYRSDPKFDGEEFKDFVAEAFGRFQAAWHDRDLTPVKDLLTEDLYEAVDEDVGRMLADGVSNRFEAEEGDIEGDVEIVEVWRESGRDFIVARLGAEMLMYTIDLESGRIVDGDAKTPALFVEYWTFTRPVGPYPWQLAVISQEDD